MLLKTHNVTVKSKHVVHSLVLEALNIDRLVLSQFYEFAYLVVFRDQVVVNVVEA